MNEKVRYFQPEETSILGAIQRTEPYDSMTLELLHWHYGLDIRG
jgi:hypothetical protein